MDGKKYIRCRKGDETIYGTRNPENGTMLTDTMCLNKKGKRYKPNIWQRGSINRNKSKRPRKSRSKRPRKFRSKRLRKSRNKSIKSRSKRRWKY
jgi:hypothetical protein